MGLLARLRRPHDPDDARESIREVTGGEGDLWHGDLEADVVEGNDAYVAVVREWAQISRGAFRPERIEERWKADAVHVSFDHDGRRHTVKAKIDEDWLDILIIEQLDPLLAADGPRFHLWDVGDQSMGVTLVTDDEAAILRKRLGRRFI